MNRIRTMVFWSCCVPIGVAGCTSVRDTKDSADADKPTFVIPDWQPDPTKTPKEDGPFADALTDDEVPDGVLRISLHLTGESDTEAEIQQQTFSDANSLIEYLASLSADELQDGILMLRPKERTNPEFDIAVIAFCRERNLNCYAHVALGIVTQRPSRLNMWIVKQTDQNAD
jgi:hypothetical protein